MEQSYKYTMNICETSLSISPWRGVLRISKLNPLYQQYPILTIFSKC